MSEVVKRRLVRGTVALGLGATTVLLSIESVLSSWSTAALLAMAAIIIVGTEPLEGLSIGPFGVDDSIEDDNG